MTTYKVTGETPYRDHEPGEEFDDDLTPDEEERALERGSVEIVKGKAKTEKEDQTGA
jgi:hypothetical protein